MNTIGIVGAGTMGNGIAQAVALAGFEAVMSDINDVQLQRGLTGDYNHIRTPLIVANTAAPQKLMAHCPLHPIYY